MEVFAGAARGAYLVCIGWTTLIVSGDVAVVGQVFIASMVTMMLGGPLLGVVVDRYDRKKLTVIAHLGIALSLAGIGLAIAADPDLAIFWFFVAVVAVTLLRHLYQISHDGLIHANVEPANLVTAVARFRGIHLLSTAAGTLATGMVIEYESSGAGFVVAAVLSIGLVISVLPVRSGSGGQAAAGLKGFVHDFAAGTAIIRGNRRLRILTLLAGIALPVGQLSNAILSSFVRDDLGRGSDVFGLIDAAWPIGGLAAAALLSLGIVRLSAPGMEYLYSMAAGAATILLALGTSVALLVMTHAAMGLAVWLCRIVIDARVLVLCDEHNVGRTRVYIDVMFSFAAIIMCFSPTLVELPSTSSYFMFWGAVIVANALILGFIDRRLNAA